MTKANLIASVASDTDCTKVVVEKVVNSLMEQLKISVADGKSLTLVGFGTFYVRDRKERTGRNPKTGEKLNIKAAKVPVFKPSQSFKDIVNAL